MIYISSAAVNSTSIEDSVKKLAGIGIRNIELSGGTVYSDNISNKLKDLKKKFSLNILIHNYFPPPRKDFVLNIASNDNVTRKKSIHFAEKSINLAYELGIYFYTLHPGYTTEFRATRESDYFIADHSSSISPGQAVTNMFESLSEIRQYAVKKGIRIGLENLFPTDDAPDGSLLCTPDDIFRYLDNFAEDRQIGFLLDLGHLVISANHFDFDKDKFIKILCKEYPHKILEIHLSGNDGKKDQHALLGSDSWQLRATQRFDLEKTPITIECRGINTPEISNQYRMIKNFIKKKN